MRILLIIVLVLGALGAGLLFAAPLLVDAEDYRTDIEAAASHAVGQPVLINGDLTFSILPTPRLQARNVGISPPKGRSEMPHLLRAEALQLRFSLRELLQGRRHVEHVVLIKPVVTLNTDLAGHRNFDGLSTEGQSLARLDVRDGSLVYDNQRSGRALSVSDIQGMIEWNQRNGVLTGALNGEVLANRVEMGFRLGTGLRPAANLEIEAAKWGRLAFTGRMASGDTWQAEGDLQMDVAALDTVLPVELLAGTAEEAIPARFSGRATLTRQRLDIPRLTGRIGDAEFGGRLNLTVDEQLEVESSLSFEQLEGKAILPWLRGVSQSVVEGRASADDLGRVNIQLGLDVGLIGYNDQFIRQLAIDSSYQNGVVAIERASALFPGGSDLAFSGDVRLTGGAFRLSGSVEAASDNLANLLNWSGLQLPEGGRGRLRNLSLSAGVEMNKDVAQVSKIDLRIDQSHVRGGAAIALSKRPSFSLNLTADKLNSNAYQTMFGDRGFDWRSIFGDPQAPDLSFLNDFDTNTSLRVQRLILESSVVRDLQLRVGLLRGVLDVQELQIGDIDGAGFTFAGRVDTPEDPQILGQGVLTTGDPAALFSGQSPLFTPMTRLSDMKVEFGIEGGLKHTAVRMDVSTGELSGHIAGLISDLLTQPLVNLDVGLRGDNASRVISTVLPGWRAPFDLFGPLLFESIVKGDADALSLAGKLDVMAARLDFDGRVAAGLGRDGDERYDMALRLRHGDTAELLQGLWSDIRLKTALKMPLDLSLKLKGDAAVFSFNDIDLKMDTYGATGAGELDMTGALPRISIALSNLTFDQAAFGFASEYGAQAAAKADDRSRRWSRLPLELDWMQRFELDAQLAFDQLGVLGIPLVDGALTARIAEGALKLSEIDAGLGSGRMTGEMTLTSRQEPALGMILSGKDMALELLFPNLLGMTDSPTGELAIELMLSGQGVTPYDLVRSLDGDVSVAKTSIGDMTGSGTVKVRNGIAKLSPPWTVMRSGGAGTIVGTIDLPRWQAELELRPGPDAAWAGQRVSGPLYGPRARTVK